MTQTEKYIWLLNTIHKSRSRGVTLKEISEKWKDYMSTEKSLDRTTFNRWKEAIELQFHVTIKCDIKGGYRYYIANPEDIDDDKVSKWLVDSISMGTTLMNNLEIKDRILLEEIPSGHENLAAIITAMKNNHRLRITYRGFGSCYSSTFPISPLCVKLYKNRWYVVGQCFYQGKWKEIIYGLDRIEDTKVLEETFIYPEDFNPEEFFEGTLGVALYENVNVETIRIRVEYPHAHYVKTLPIHPSQRLIVDEDGDYAEFDITVRPTEEFFMEMLHGGGWIKVLSPAHVVEQMRGWVNELYEIYNRKLNIKFHSMQQDKIKRSERTRRLMEQEDFEPIFKKESIIKNDSIIKGMFPNYEDYQDYLDGEI